MEGSYARLIDVCITPGSTVIKKEERKKGSESGIGTHRVRGFWIHGSGFQRSRVEVEVYCEVEENWGLRLRASGVHRDENRDQVRAWLVLSLSPERKKGKEEEELG